MKNEFTQSTTNKMLGYVALHSMVNRISISSMSSASRKHSIIINDIPKDLEKNTNENMLATVLGSLLHTVIGNTENSCIRISAKLCEAVVLVYVKETHRLSNAAFTGSLRQV